VKELSDICVCVVDHGLGLPIAERLARDVKRVLYFSEWQEGFSTVNKGIIGWGIPNIERCYDFWEIKNEVDLWVFPDIQRSGEQKELESQGKPVWGSRGAYRIETNRERFLDLLETLGLDVPEYRICDGITELRNYLKDQEDCYIKISKYRGSLETKHWRNWKLDANLLDLWAVRFGAVRELIPFIVVQAINTPLEIGGDTYCVDGWWPSLMLHGIEKKDESYFAAVTPRDEMPEQVRKVLDAFGPVFSEHHYRNEFSCEIRVKDDAAYFLDPTCRLGLPSTSSQLELWGNYSEILWLGANGALVNPKPLGKYSAEVILHAKADDNIWPTVEVPSELRQWVKLADCCEVDGVRSWPREGGDDDSAGWLVAIGDTLTETLEKLKDYVSKLPDGLTADIAPIAEVIKEIELEAKEGIEFGTGQTLPEPATVLEDA
jgi:hypothetical protein